MERLCEGALRSVTTRRGEHLPARWTLALRVAAGAAPAEASWPHGPCSAAHVRRLGEAAQRALQSGHWGVSAYVLSAVAMAAAKMAQEGDTEPRKAACKAWDHFLAAACPAACASNPAATAAMLTLLQGLKDATECATTPAASPKETPLLSTLYSRRLVSTLVAVLAVDPVPSATSLHALHAAAAGFLASHAAGAPVDAAHTLLRAAQRDADVRANIERILARPIASMHSCVTYVALCNFFRVILRIWRSVQPTDTDAAREIFAWARGLNTTAVETLGYAAEQDVPDAARVAAYAKAAPAEFVTQSADCEQWSLTDPVEEGDEQMVQVLKDAGVASKVDCRIGGPGGGGKSSAPSPAAFVTANSLEWIWWGEGDGMCAVVVQLADLVDITTSHGVVELRLRSSTSEGAAPAGTGGGVLRAVPATPTLAVGSLRALPMLRRSAHNNWVLRFASSRPESDFIPHLFGALRIAAPATCRVGSAESVSQRDARDASASASAAAGVASSATGGMSIFDASLSRRMDHDDDEEDEDNNAADHSIPYAATTHRPSHPFDAPTAPTSSSDRSPAAANGRHSSSTSTGAPHTNNTNTPNNTPNNTAAGAFPFPLFSQSQAESSAPRPRQRHSSVAIFPLAAQRPVSATNTTDAKAAAESAAAAAAGAALAASFRFDDAASVVSSLPDHPMPLDLTPEDEAATLPPKSPPAPSADIPKSTTAKKPKHRDHDRGAKASDPKATSSTSSAPKRPATSNASNASAASAPPAPAASAAHRKPAQPAAPAKMKPKPTRRKDDTSSDEGEESEDSTYNPEHEEEEEEEEEEESEENEESEEESEEEESEERPAMDATHSKESAPTSPTLSSSQSSMDDTNGARRSMRLATKQPMRSRQKEQRRSKKSSASRNRRRRRASAAAAAATIPIATPPPPPPAPRTAVQEASASASASAAAAPQPRQRSPTPAPHAVRAKVVAEVCMATQTEDMTVPEEMEQTAPRAEPVVKVDAGVQANVPVSLKEVFAGIATHARQMRTEKSQDAVQRLLREEEMAVAEFDDRAHMVVRHLESRLETIACESMDKVRRILQNLQQAVLGVDEALQRRDQLAASVTQRCSALSDAIQGWAAHADMRTSAAADALRTHDNKSTTGTFASATSTTNPLSNPTTTTTPRLRHHHYHTSDLDTVATAAPWSTYTSKTLPAASLFPSTSHPHPLRATVRMVPGIHSTTAVPDERCGVEDEDANSASSELSTAIRHVLGARPSSSTNVTPSDPPRLSAPVGSRKGTASKSDVRSTDPRSHVPSRSTPHDFSSEPTTTTTTSTRSTHSTHSNTKPVVRRLTDIGSKRPTHLHRHHADDDEEDEEEGVDGEVEEERGEVEDDAAAPGGMRRRDQRYIHFSPLAKMRRGAHMADVSSAEKAVPRRVPVRRSEHDPLPTSVDRARAPTRGATPFEYDDDDSRMRRRSSHRGEEQRVHQSRPTHHRDEDEQDWDRDEEVLSPRTPAVRRHSHRGPRRSVRDDERERERVPRRDAADARAARRSAWQQDEGEEDEEELEMEEGEEATKTAARHALIARDMRKRAGSRGHEEDDEPAPPKMASKKPQQREEEGEEGYVPETKAAASRKEGSSAWASAQTPAVRRVHKRHETEDEQEDDDEAEPTLRQERGEKGAEASRDTTMRQRSESGEEHAPAKKAAASASSRTTPAAAPTRPRREEEEEVERGDRKHKRDQGDEDRRASTTSRAKQPAPISRPRGEDEEGNEEDRKHLRASKRDQGEEDRRASITSRAKPPAPISRPREDDEEEHKRAQEHKRQDAAPTPSLPTTSRATPATPAPAPMRPRHEKEEDEEDEGDDEEEEYVPKKASKPARSAQRSSRASTRAKSASRLANDAGGGEEFAPVKMATQKAPPQQRASSTGRPGAQTADAKKPTTSSSRASPAASPLTMDADGAETVEQTARQRDMVAAMDADTTAADGAMRARQSASSIVTYSRTPAPSTARSAPAAPAPHSAGASSKSAATARAVDHSSPAAALHRPAFLSTAIGNLRVAPKQSPPPASAPAKKSPPSNIGPPAGAAPAKSKDDYEFDD